MFYTDTNGQAPRKRCFALIFLEAAMGTRMLHEIKVEEFNALRADIGNLGANLKGNTFPHLKHRKTSGCPQSALEIKLTHYQTSFTTANKNFICNYDNKSMSIDKKCQQYAGGALV
jgi:hypothetical protein